MIFHPCESSGRLEICTGQVQNEGIQMNLHRKKTFTLFLLQGFKGGVRQITLNGRFCTELKVDFENEP